MANLFRCLLCVPLLAVFAQEKSCASTTCTRCLYEYNIPQLGASSGTACYWCRDDNATGVHLEGMCYSKKTSDGCFNSPGNFTFEDKLYSLLVTKGEECSILTKKDIIIASIAGGAGGLVLAGVAMWLYCRKKRKRQERLQAFKLREEDALRNKRLDLDRDMQGSKNAEGFNANIRKIQARMRESACENNPALSAQLQQKEQMELSSLKSQRRFQVLSENGLRVRESPSATAAMLGGLKHNAIIVALAVKGNWIQVSQNGWAMAESNDGKKLFLQELPREEPTRAAPNINVEPEPEG